MLKNKWCTNCKTKKETVEFKNYSRQLAVPFKIIADFECNFEKVKSNEIKNKSYTEKYQNHIPCSFSYKLVCVDNKFSKAIIVYRGENAAYKFIEAIIKEYEYCTKIMEKLFNKNLIISEDEQQQFLSTNPCRICKNTSVMKK